MNVAALPATEVRAAAGLIERLTGLDRLMLGASRRWPQDIGAVAILDGTSLLDSRGHLLIEPVRRAIEARLHQVPRFRQVVVSPRRGLGAPYWKDCRSFDLAQHVREHPLAPPGGEAELLDAVEHIRRRPLESSRPLWEMWLLTGLPDRRIGLFVRIHHIIADGVAAMTAVAAFLDVDPDSTIGASSPWTPAPAPTTRELLSDSLRRRATGVAGMLAHLVRPSASWQRVRQAWPALRGLFTGEPPIRTSLDEMIGLERSLALIHSPLDDVKEVARSHGATVNDVLLTATAGGLRALLASRGEPVDDTTARVFVPVSLRSQREVPQQGNQIAQMVVPIALGEVDPVRRLRQVAAETSARKAKSPTSLDVLMRGRLLRLLMLRAVLRQRVNTATTSIVGPPMPLHLAGARVVAVYPMLPLIANEPLGIGALSYAGDLFFGIVAAAESVPDVGVFTAAFRDDLAALGAQPRTSPDLVAADAVRGEERTTP